MKEFLYWEQIQERLSQRVQDGKEPYSFYDAARELWKGGLRTPQNTFRWYPLRIGMPWIWTSSRRSITASPST